MKKLITVLAGLSLAFGISTTALAHTGDDPAASHEEDEFPCPATAAEAEGNAEAQAQCTYDADGNLVDPADTYTVSDNEVTCADNNGTKGAGAPVAVNSASNEAGDGGYLEVCSDSDLPLHGRIILQGSASEGGSIIADGDETNRAIADQLAGWARVDVSGAGVGVRCGADDGRLDATHPEAGDTQAECG